MMPNIVDGMVDNLLRLAEERLKSDLSSMQSTHDQSSFTVETRGNVCASGLTNEKLSIRQPEAHSCSRRVIKNSAGPQWFDLPKTDLTPDFKREWQLLRMRGLLDPKNQKKAIRVAAPEFSQIGEVIAGPTDFFSGRLTKKDRKATLTGEMIGAVDGQKLRTRFAGIQRMKASGKKSFHQRLVSTRRKRQT